MGPVPVSAEAAEAAPAGDEAQPRRVDSATYFDAVDDAAISVSGCAVADGHSGTAGNVNVAAMPAHHRHSAPVNELASL